MALYSTFQHIIDKGGAENISDEELKDYIMQVWPSQKKDIGGYSHNLPPLSKKDVWSEFLYVVKNIVPETTSRIC